jgi:hypothetical protein
MATLNQRVYAKDKGNYGLWRALASSGADLVLTLNQRVEGSSPPAPTILLQAGVGRFPSNARMSDDKVSLELLGARVLTLSAEVHDLQVRFTAMEHRFAALETRFTAMEARLSGIEGRLGGLEERMSAMLALIVRIAERLDGGDR